jgi:hypothetical protein
MILAYAKTAQGGWRFWPFQLKSLFDLFVVRKLFTHSPNGQGFLVPGILYNHPVVMK